MSACLCCTETRTSGRFFVPETVQGTGDLFEYVECARCHSLQLATIPRDLSRYYEGDYYSFRVPSVRARPLRDGARRLLVRAAARSGRAGGIVLRAQKPLPLDWMRDFDTPLDEPILDVGAGAGGLLSRLAQLGFSQLDGLEPHLPASTRAPPGVHLFAEKLEELQRRYALIVFRYSLEHLIDPLSALVHARRLLLPMGRIVVRVPLLGGSFRRHGVSFAGLEEAPRHVFVPTVEGMHSLAEHAGLVAERVTYDGKPMHVLLSRRRARDGMIPRHRSPRRPTLPDRLYARVVSRVQNLLAEGDAATFIFRAD